MQDDAAAILDIVTACRLAQDFAAGLDKAAFLADPKTQSSVVHQLIVLGEAVKRLSGEFREQHSTIPWRRIVRRDIPALLESLNPLVPRLPEEEG